LDALMPRAARRSRRVQDQELDLTDSASEDEVEPTPVKVRGRRTTAITKKPIAKGRKALAEKKTAQSTTKTVKKSTGEGKRRITYGRGDDEEKENDQDSEFLPEVIELEESSVLEEVNKSAELTKMKNKFAEVDDWEMEYESVDLGGGTSSPWR
jgi:hypothetical protein